MELGAFFQAHPHVSVTLYRDEDGRQALHMASRGRHTACVRMLLQHGADVHAIDDDGDTALLRMDTRMKKKCVKLLIEANADVNAAGNNGQTAVHTASRWGKLKCLKLLVDNGADVNARIKHGTTPAMEACELNQLSCLQLLVDNKADLNLRDDGIDALYFAIESGISFPVLCYNTDIKTVHTEPGSDTDDEVTEPTIAACILEYKETQTYIDDYHGILKELLSTKVEVDLRLGVGDSGIYQEPLERVLEYLGLSMNKDQVVNTSIDGTERKRALIPTHALITEHWYNRASKRRRHCELQRNIIACQAEMDALNAD
jgi:hypothetical protein